AASASAVPAPTQTPSVVASGRTDSDRVRRTRRLSLSRAEDLSVRLVHRRPMPRPRDSALDPKGWPGRRRFRAASRTSCPAVKHSRLRTRTGSAWARMVVRRFLGGSRLVGA
ncbi:hypothetical protein pipiens_000477, partial [Culex pipiens pipiens]